MGGNWAPVFQTPPGYTAPIVGGIAPTLPAAMPDYSQPQNSVPVMGINPTLAPLVDPRFPVPIGPSYNAR